MKSVPIATYPLLLSLCFLMIACDPARVFEENRQMPDHTWDQDNKVIFQVNVADTISRFNFFINIRNTGEYEFSNLFIFVNIISPDGKIQTDTIECPLADVTGRWYGKGWGNIYDNRILFKHHVRFANTGKFTITFGQAMRKDRLEHITDVGFRVEKTN